MCELHIFRIFSILSAFFSTVCAWGADFHPPAGQNCALVSASGTILPGGRILKPWGTQFDTGPGSFGLPVSPKGTVAVADIGYERFARDGSPGREGFCPGRARSCGFAPHPVARRRPVRQTQLRLPRQYEFPGLLRTAFELLRLPPLHLMDATAASLADMFTDTPDFTPFTAHPPDPRIFSPAR